MGLTIMRYLVFLLVALSFQAQSATFWNRFTTNADNVSVNGSTLTNLLVFTNTQTVWVNSNGVTGVRGVMEKPFSTFAGAVSNSLPGDTIFLLGNTTVTNTAWEIAAVPTGHLPMTNLNIIGNGATLTLVGTLAADQLHTWGNISIRDLTITNKHYLSSVYPISLHGANALSLDTVNVFSHGTVIYSDGATAKPFHANNCLWLTDSKTNATVMGGGGYNGDLTSCRLISFGTNGNYGFASTVSNILVFNSPLFAQTNGYAQNINLSTSDGDNIIVNGGIFQCHAPTVDGSSFGNCAIEFYGSLGQSLILNNCDFDLAKNGAMTFLCRMINNDDGATPFGTPVLNNCNYRPLTNGIIFDNTGGGSGSFPVIVSGGNLVPSNFADPANVTWSRPITSFTNNTAALTASTATTYSGKVKMATLSGATYTVTHAAVTTSAAIIATINTVDTTATLVRAVPGTGSFTLVFGAAPTVATDVTWQIISP